MSFFITRSSSLSRSLSLSPPLTITVSFFLKSSHRARCPLLSLSLHPFFYLSTFPSKRQCLVSLSLNFYFCPLNIFLSFYLSFVPLSLSPPLSRSLSLPGFNLIYSQHYLVWRGDKHSFAYLMNQTHTCPAPIIFGKTKCAFIHMCAHVPIPTWMYVCVTMCANATTDTDTRTHAHNLSHTQTHTSKFCPFI